MARVLSHDELQQAAAALVSQLASHLAAERVSLGWLVDGETRLLALSHGALPDSGSDTARRLSAALAECIAQKESVHYPASPGSPPQIVLAHQAIQRHTGGRVFSLPLAQAGEVLGAVLVEGVPDTESPLSATGEIEHQLALVAPYLAALQQNERGLRRHALDKFRQARERLRREHSALRRRLGLAAIIALLLALLAPWPYHIEGKATIEGEIQRVIVAPADGFLKDVLVRPGDQVAAGQLLLELADQELQSERRKWESDLAQHQNAYAAALARADRASLVINQARADEARARLDMVDQELGRSRIEAPFAGTVVAGELSPALGAPVKRGVPLLTLVPGERYRVVIQIDERDIGDARVGQSGRVALSALPWSAQDIRVTRITPMASAVAGANVFAVEAEFVGTVSGLRPGLQGVAKLEAGHLPPLWAWSKRSAAWVALRLWSWFGI